MNTISVFLASSAELEADRKAFEIFIRRENDNYYIPNGINLQLRLWENFIDAMSPTRMQDEYNKAISSCDIFVMLFFSKVGKYTAEEFEKAFKQFKETNKPLIYTYFKNVPIKIGSLNQDDTMSLWAFQKKLLELGHFQTEYETDEKLALDFKQQMDKLFLAGHFKFPGNDIAASPGTPKCLSAGQPSIPPNFVGRILQLADIQKKLDDNGLLLINAEGGMGKTSLAAKYLVENLTRYNHYAWLFCDNGITDQVKTLAGPLKADISSCKNEDEQLLAVKTSMENLPKNCLLILDNVNDPKHIAAFQEKLGGLSWHVIITSRCQEVLPKQNEYTLNHLAPQEAKTLFKAFHDEGTPEFETILDNFLTAIGYNTLLIELFSKNLHELSPLGETMAKTMEHFKEKGLFLGEKSFEIQTAYTGNVHKNAATTDQVLEVLYDINSLEETEQSLLVQMSLLPAESQQLTFLIDVFTPANQVIFLKQLKSLAQKGWLGTDTKTYRMSPLVQQIIVAKNKGRLSQYATALIDTLNEKLQYDGTTFVNIPNYRTALPYAALGLSITGLVNDPTTGMALLSLNLSDYYKDIGNFKISLSLLKRAADIFKDADKRNYVVCLERLGSFYQQQGNLEEALKYFKPRVALGEELLKSEPADEAVKSSFAIGYEKLGDVYRQQGNFDSARDLFERRAGLAKELYEANPGNTVFKEGLAISYFKLGDLHLQDKNYKLAKDYLEQEGDLFKEMLKESPANENVKYGLATYYEKIGNIYQQQGDFNNALTFYKLQKDICKQLFDANADAVRIREGLGDACFNLAAIYLKLNLAQDAATEVENAKAIFEQLAKDVPEAIEYQKKLGLAKELC